MSGPRRRRVVYDQQSGVADELIDEFTPSDIVHVLQHLNFNKDKSKMCPIWIDAGIATFLIRMLERR